MELNITVDGETDEADIAALKKFLEQEGVHGLDEVGLQRAPLQPGDQGLGEVIGVIMKFSGADGVLNTLIGALSEFAKQFDKRLKGPNGIVIDSKGMTAEQRTQIALAWGD